MMNTKKNQNTLALRDELLLITGTSSGLGYSIVKKFLERGASVISISRNIDNLSLLKNELAGNNQLFYYQFDIENVEKIKDLFNQIVQEVGRSPSILINNVGYQVAGFIHNTPLESYQKNYRVNTLAPLALIQCVLPEMVKNNRGIIANVMSSILYQSFPGVSSYAASKKALLGIHESLKYELSGTGIKTLDIRPGTFKSNYWLNTEVNERIPNFKIPSDSKKRNPDEIADIICNAILYGQEKVDLSTIKDRIGFHLKYWRPSILDKIIISKNKKMIPNFKEINF